MEGAQKISQLAIRTCGGQSMLKSLPLERIFRDSRCGSLMLPWTAEICMDRLGKISSKNNILVTDAGSNYYVGGQVWNFENGQREVSSYTNAAMGLTIPLAIGAAVASPRANILAVTGDGSLELNIQELKTISHNKFNIKLFVINNGGYVSMHNWADAFFEGRRVGNPVDTGDGTLILKNVAKAFDMEHRLISSTNNLDKILFE